MRTRLARPCRSPWSLWLLPSAYRPWASSSTPSFACSGCCRPRSQLRGRFAAWASGRCTSTWPEGRPHSRRAVSAWRRCPLGGTASTAGSGLTEKLRLTPSSPVRPCVPSPVSPWRWSLRAGTLPLPGRARDSAVPKVALALRAPALLSPRGVTAARLSCDAGLLELGWRSLKGCVKIWCKTCGCVCRSVSFARIRTSPALSLPLLARARRGPRADGVGRGVPVPRQPPLTGSRRGLRVRWTRSSSTGMPLRRPRGLKCSRPLARPTTDLLPMRSEWMWHLPVPALRPLMGLRLPCRPTRWQPPLPVRRLYMGIALTSTPMKSAPRSWTLCRLPRERVMTMAVILPPVAAGIPWMISTTPPAALSTANSAVGPSSALSSGAGATGLLATLRGRLAPLATTRTTLVFCPRSSKRTKEGCRLRLRLLRQLASSLAWGTESGHAVTSLVVTFVADALVE